MNGYTGLLDPALHTFDYVSSRSAFLLSVCLQVAAARSLRTDGIAKQLLLHIRETLWPNVLVRNLRSVAICQACMIWGSFADTSDISDDETTWFLFGHAREQFCIFEIEGILKNDLSTDVRRIGPFSRLASGYGTFRPRQSCTSRCTKVLANLLHR